jgi:hypothetical protein
MLELQSYLISCMHMYMYSLCEFIESVALVGLQRKHVLHFHNCLMCHSNLVLVVSCILHNFNLIIITCSTTIQVIRLIYKQCNKCVIGGHVFVER